MILDSKPYIYIYNIHIYNTLNSKLLTNVNVNVKINAIQTNEYFIVVLVVEFRV